MTTIAIPQLFVGVDIAATTFTAAWACDRNAGRMQPVIFDQTPAGFTGLQTHLQRTGVRSADTLIVVEATGSYWVALASAMHTAGYQIAVVNPAQVHNYAKSLPRRAKTDALDAHLLLPFALERQPTRWTPPAAVYHELRQRLVARDGILEMREHARNQRHALQQWPVHVEAVLEQLDSSINDLTTRLETLDAELVRVLRDGAWAESAQLLASIPGIGPITSGWLLVSTMNFTTCTTAAQLAAYAGLVPMAYESGRSVRGRACIGHGGYKRLRTALSMATRTAARFNPGIRRSYERLRAAGKPMKVARCAVARKRIHLVWAMVTKRQPFCREIALATPRAS